MRANREPSPIVTTPAATAFCGASAMARRRDWRVDRLVDKLDAALAVRARS